MSSVRITLGHRAMRLNHDFKAFQNNDRELAPLLHTLRGYLSELEAICNGKAEIDETELGRLSLAPEEKHDDTVT